MPAVPSSPNVCTCASGDDNFRPRRHVIGRFATAAPSAAQAATPCELGRSHKPARQRVNDKAYWLCQAASDGCRSCFRQFLEVGEVDPECRSHWQGYSVLDWAVWAREKGKPGAEAVE